MRQVGCGRFLYLDTWCPEAALLQLKPAGEHGLARLTVAVLLAVLKRQSPRQRYRRPRSCLVDMKAVGAVLVYVVIVLTSTALTGGAGLHTGERRLKYGHFLGQTLYVLPLHLLLHQT